MSTQLIPLDPNLAVPIAVQQPVLLVGRHPEADVRLPATMISRRHCCLAVVYDQVMIRDLGSRHGIFVNGIRVDEARLNPGDEVAIAHLIYRFEVTRPVAQPTSPKPKAQPEPEPAVFPALDLEFSDDELVPLDD